MPAPEVPETPADDYYTPEKIDFWLRNWELMQSLAETPATSVHYLTPEHFLRDGPCIPAPRPMQASRGKRSDPYRYADIEADLERAWTRLGRWSLEARAVEAKMAGQSLHHLARAIQRRDKDVYGAYWEGVKQMAKTLGWVEPEEKGR